MGKYEWSPFAWFKPYPHLDLLKVVKNCDSNKKPVIFFLLPTFI